MAKKRSFLIKTNFASRHVTSLSSKQPLVAYAAPKYCPRRDDHKTMDSFGALYIQRFTKGTGGMKLEHEGSEGRYEERVCQDRRSQNSIVGYVLSQRAQVVWSWSMKATLGLRGRLRITIYGPTNASRLPDITGSQTHQTDTLSRNSVLRTVALSRVQSATCLFEPARP